MGLNPKQRVVEAGVLATAVGNEFEQEVER